MWRGGLAGRRTVAKVVQGLNRKLCVSVGDELAGGATYVDGVADAFDVVGVAPHCLLQTNESNLSTAGSFNSTLFLFIIETPRKGMENPV